MPWVSEWVKENGHWVNKNYYVKPKDRPAGGEDYKRKVTIHTYTDANTGKKVSTAQHSSTVSYNEGKSIAKRVTKSHQPQTMTQTIEFGTGRTITKTKTYDLKNDTTTIKTKVERIKRTYTDPKTGKTISESEYYQKKYDEAQKKKFLPIKKINDKTPKKKTVHIIGVKDKGLFETKESYKRRKESAKKLEQFKDKQAERESFYDSIKPDVKYRVEMPGLNASKIVKGSELLAERNSYASVVQKTKEKNYEDYLVKESKRQEKSFFGTIADVYRSDKGKVLGKFQEPMARASEGFEMFENSAKWLVNAGVETIDDPVGAVANIGLGVVSAGLIPLYNLGTTITRATGNNQFKPLIIETPLKTGFKKVTDPILNEWHPMNPLDPNVKLDSTRRLIGGIGAVSGTVLGGMLIGDAVTKPIINKLKSMPRVSTVIKSFELGKGNFLHLAKSRIKSVFGRDKEIDAIGGTKITGDYEFSLGNNQARIYSAKSMIITSGKKFIDYTDELGFQVNKDGKFFDASLIKSDKGLSLSASAGVKLSDSIDDISLTVDYGDLSFTMPNSKIIQRGLGNIYDISHKIEKDYIDLAFTETAKFGYTLNKFDLDSNINMFKVEGRTSSENYFKELYGTTSQATKEFDKIDEFLNLPGKGSIASVMKDIAKPIILSSIATDIAITQGISSIGGATFGLMGINQSKSKSKTATISKSKVEVFELEDEIIKEIEEPYLDYEGKIITETSPESIRILKNINTPITETGISTQTISIEEAIPITPIPTIPDFNMPTIPTHTNLGQGSVLRLPKIPLFGDFGINSFSKPSKHRRSFLYSPDFESLILDIGGGTGELKVFTGLERRRKVTKKRKVRSRVVKRKVSKRRIKKTKRRIRTTRKPIRKPKSLFGKLNDYLGGII